MSKRGKIAELLLLQCFEMWMWTVTAPWIQHEDVHYNLTLSTSALRIVYSEVKLEVIQNVAACIDAATLK